MSDDCTSALSIPADTESPVPVREASVSPPRLRLVVEAVAKDE